MALEQETYFMNISPTPATGVGVVRLVAELCGETVVRLDPHIGFSHRGIEKFLEQNNFLQGTCFLDRLYYGIAFASEYGFVLAGEKLTGIAPPLRAQYIRVLMAELTRISSHLTATSCLAQDTGTNVIESIVQQANVLILSFFTRVCGYGMPSAYFRIGGVKNDIPQSLCDVLFSFTTKQMPDFLLQIEEFLTENPIFKARTQGIGEISSDKALAFGFSGVNLRASGISWDLRRAEPYDIYADLAFEVPVSKKSDCYTRFILRLEEIRHSMSIIKQIISSMPEGDVNSLELVSDGSLESQIAHFKFYSQGTPLPAGETYTATESPLGEFGVYMVSDGSSVPYRCHIKSAGFSHLQALNELVKGHQFADIRPILSSLNIKMNEVDR